MSDALPPAALLALQQGKRIEAVKIIREATGLGLEEALALVQSYEQGDSRQDSKSVDQSSAALRALPGVVTALASGRKIAAVKIVREHFGVGLKDAKDLVDRLQSELRHSGALPPAPVRSINWGVMLGVGLIALATIAWLLGWSEW